MEKSVLCVGFGRRTVMPEHYEDVHLSGDDDAYAKCYGVWDPLKYTCIALSQDGGETVLVFTMDILDGNEYWTAPMRTHISKALDMPEERIFLCATHTHAGPSMDYPWKGNEKFKEDLRIGLIAAAKEALADRCPVQVYYGSEHIDDLVFLRHYRYKDGHVSFGRAGNPELEDYAAKKDSEMQVVRFVRPEGKKDVVMMCNNAHATMASGLYSGRLTADFPGRVRDYVESQGDYLLAYFYGAGGNQTTDSCFIPHRHGMDYRSYGRELGTRVVRLLSGLVKCSDTKLSVCVRDIQVRSNKEKLDMEPQAREVVAAHEQGGGKEASAPLCQKYGFWSYLEARAILRRLTLPETLTARQALIGIGDQLSFLFAPYEMFSEQSSYLRKNTPYDMTFISGMGNGTIGYLPSRAAFEYGCYESWTTPFARGACEEVSESYLELLAQLKKGEFDK